MAGSATGLGRHRSLTGTSRGLSPEEQKSETARLVRELDFSQPSGGEFARLDGVAQRLCTHLHSDERAATIFRHGGGFESLLMVLDSISSLPTGTSTELERITNALANMLRVLGAALKDEPGNQKYFASFLGGWDQIERLLQRVQDAALAVPGLALSSFLLKLLISLYSLALGDEAVTEQMWKADKDLQGSRNELAAHNHVQLRDPCAIAIKLSLRTQVIPIGDDRGIQDVVIQSLKIADALATCNLRSRTALWSTDLLSSLLPQALKEEHSPVITKHVTTLILSLVEFGLPTLNDTALLFSLACKSEVAQNIVLRALQSCQAPDFVQFDLSASGYSSIELPSIPRAFPPSAGYTLTAWVRIDEFDEDCHTTLFGAFDTSQTCFILLYLEKDSRQLILQTSIRSSRPSVRFKSFRFHVGQWYHIVVVQQKLNADPRQSPVALFVNGEFQEQVKCAYPEAPAGLNEAKMPDRSVPVNPNRPTPVQAFFGTPHDLAVRVGKNVTKSKWSLANACLYSAILSDEFIAVQHKLGPRYSGNFQDCLGPLLTYRASAELNRYNELLHPDRSEQSDIVTVTERRGSDVLNENRILICISAASIVRLDEASTTGIKAIYQLQPRAMKRLETLAQKTRAVAVNAAVPHFNDAFARSFGVGVLIGDPLVVIPSPLHDASWRLTGSIPVSIRMLEAASSGESFIRAAKIFMNIVKDNWRVSEAMEKGNGYGMFALIIREKLQFENGSTNGAHARKPSSPLSLAERRQLPEQLLPLILSFVGYNASKPEDSMIVNPMAYRVLLVEFDTWRRCDLDTQKLFYRQVTQLVTNNVHQAFNQKRLIRMRLVRKFIEALKHEDICKSSVPFLMEALRALLRGTGSWVLYRELAMFVTFGLQDERSLLKPTYSIASIANAHQRGALWARKTRGSRAKSTEIGTTEMVTYATRAELAVEVLELLSDVLCDTSNKQSLQRFYDSRRGMPNRWALHLLAENSERIALLALRIVHHSLDALNSNFKTSFADKSGGFIVLKNRMKAFWRSRLVWISCFGLFFGRPGLTIAESDVSIFTLIEGFHVDDELEVKHPEMLSVIMNMLETGLRNIVATERPDEYDTSTVRIIIQFLGEVYARSGNFRDFVVGSRYLQELLFILYPVLVGSDRLSADMEFKAEKDALSFNGQEVTMRPHSNSLDERPPSVRSLRVGEEKPAVVGRNQVAKPRRLSSFVLINPQNNGQSATPATPARFQPSLLPRLSEPIKMKIGNTTVEALMEHASNLFIDSICCRRDFQGMGLFLKVPPGFREHQAYFESYILVNTLSQLWNHLQLDQQLLTQTKILTNLAKYSQHLTEALFEGWFIDGAQPVLDFTGKLLEYLQQSEVAALNDVRLCSHHINAIRIVFLRVTLWRLAELDEAVDESETVAFLDQMNYWQTILFANENQESLFTRLICFAVYMKLVSEVTAVRMAAARIWRTILVQKPTEAATLLTFAVGSDQRHLATGFMKLVSMDDEDFLKWVDENLESLDSVFVGALKKPWDDFVNEENRRNQDTAKLRLAKRRERLRQWHAEEEANDDALRRYEVATNHWRSNVHSQERLRLKRALQDQQESFSHLAEQFNAMDNGIRQPCGIEPVTGKLKWKLDETEAANRMRMRIVPDVSNETRVFQPKRRGTVQKAPAIVSQATASGESTPPLIGPTTSSDVTEFPPFEDDEGNGRSRADSTTGSQLLEGGFEMIDDPNEGDDGLVEDKNRKILTSLQRGDECQQLYNVSRIVGLEACEGLLVVGKKCLYLQDHYFQRTDGEIVSVSQAPKDERDPYVQLISGKDIGHNVTRSDLGDQNTRHWTWREVLSISKRRFLFRDVSVEVFFTDGRSYLLTCISPKIRDELYSAVLVRAPHVHSSSAIASEDAWRLDTLRNPEEAPQTLGSKFASVFNNSPGLAATKKWLRGEMSNFQYLMLLNTMAGRTFNDLTQYPVFPWVLADYSSETLDLDNPRSFRDLSKPMGCQSLARESEFRDRYRQFAEMGDHNAPPFHYGTHYSSAMIVSSYLIRLQPFVQSYLLLQGGHFDHADRLFDSIEKAWLSASRETMSDVRELTPEFFYLPEFLQNINHYDFGQKQGSQETVNNVRLPPWAKGDPHLFVAKNREALESPHVSQDLHKWIDLVFGYKQRGEAAIEATNVFHHLSYRGARDLDAIDDPIERLASIGIIHSFGQTPHQIFQRPHPAREVIRGPMARLDRATESLIRLPDPLFHNEEKIANLSFSTTHERLLSAGPGKLNLLPHCDRYLQWGFADHSVRFYSTNTRRLMGLYENLHIGAVMTATLVDSKTLVTGGVDCTIGIWTITPTRDIINLQLRTYLFGHRTAVTILAASRICSTLVSASQDGQVLIWGLNRLQCIRELHIKGSTAVQHIQISDATGHILICQGAYALLYTLNGTLLLKQKVCESPDECITTCAFQNGGGNEWLERELIFTGHSRGIVNVWSLTTLTDGAWHLQLLKRMNHTDPNREDGGNVSAAITAVLPMSTSVYTGDEDGRVYQWDVVQRSLSIARR